MNHRKLCATSAAKAQLFQAYLNVHGMYITFEMVAKRTRDATYYRRFHVCARCKLHGYTCVRFKSFSFGRKA